MSALGGRFVALGLLMAAGCSFSGTGLTVGQAGESTGADAETGTTAGEAPTTTMQGSAATEAADTTNVATAAEATTTAAATLTTGEDTGEAGSGSSAEATAAEGSSSTGECTDPVVWYVDVDGDGYGEASMMVMACAQPDGYADNADDCDDHDGLRSPGQVEQCDNKDNDCDPLVDEYSPMNTMCGGCKIVPDDAGEPTRAYYFCSAVKRSWDQAKELCEDRSAVLVADEEASEHDFLVAEIAAIDAMSGGWWTGGWAPGVLGYQWLGGGDISGADERWDFLQVGSDPNKCVQLLSPGVNNGGKWTARGCNEQKPYVCEQAL